MDKRGDFENIQSIVLSQQESGGKNITYNIFEIPNANGNFFKTRLHFLENYLKKSK